MADSSTATPKKRAPARRKPAAKARTAASKRTARSTATRPATRSARAQQLAERAVLIPVGAALEARDRVAGTVEGLVTTTRSRSELEKQLRRFERRGGSARTQLERRTRTARRGFERQRTQARRNLDLNVEALSTRVEPLKTGVGKMVQNGRDAGIKLVNGVQERLPKVV
jgi:hypothetical protein